MPLTRRDTEQAATRAAALLRELQTGNPDANLRPLRQVVDAQRNILEAQAQLDVAARAAHQAGFSWTIIGGLLGVKRQTACERFSQR